MVLSVIRFGIKQTEAVAFGAVRLGLNVARTVIDVVVDAATPSRPQHEPFAPDSSERSETAEPAGRMAEPPGRAERSAEPPAQAERSAEPAARSTQASEPEAPLDPERERRIALRDQPSANQEESPHHVLNNPVTDDPDPTEWPDPYDQREDPRDPGSDEIVLPGDAPHTPTGSQSTSDPHPSQDPEAARWNGPKAPDSPR